MQAPKDVLIGTKGSPKPPQLRAFLLLHGFKLDFGRHFGVAMGLLWCLPIWK